jgi:hypothetical protein
VKRGVVVALALAAACAEPPAGRPCQPGDDAFCGEGFQCLTFCDAAGGPDSICTPSFGVPAGDEWSDQGLIDGKTAFGELGNVKRFARDLRIEIREVKGVALPRLEEVEENLSIVATDLECLSLPRLTRVGGVVTIDLNDALARIEIAALETAGGLIVTDNRVLPELLPTALVDVAGDVVIERNRAVSLINLESLATVGGDLTAAGAGLRRVDLDVLGRVDGCVRIDFADGCAEPPALDGTTCCGDVLRGGTCPDCP